MLTDQEKAFVREMSMNPLFGSILQKLDEHAKVPRYKKDARTPDDVKERHWVRDSGYRDAIDFVLSVLGYYNE